MSRLSEEGPRCPHGKLYRKKAEASDAKRAARPKWGRRMFMGTVGAGALALPFARILKGHATDTFPTRFVVFFTPNGTIPPEWIPDGGETDFTLRQILQPLEPFRDRLMVLQGVDMNTAYEGPGDGHQTGMGTMLTGVELLPGDTAGGCDSCAAVSWANGISVDQRIANEIGNSTRFRSLELGVQVGSSDNIWTRMCYQGASEPLPPSDDPFAVFERVFGDLGADPLGIEKRREMRQSVIDFNKQDFATLRTKLGAADRTRLDAHLAGVREVERRLSNATTLGAACAAPTLGSRIDVHASENYPAVGQMQMDLLTMALACDMTRVASLQWTHSVGNIVMSWLGISDRHHDLSHEGDSNTDAQNKLIAINNWYAQQLAYLCQSMDAIPEGSGTLLDHTVILWCNELGKGNTHTRRNVPYVLAGGAGGYFRMGRYLQKDTTSHNDLLVSLCNACGVATDTFGDSRYCTGPIPDLV